MKHVLTRSTILLSIFILTAVATVVSAQTLPAQVRSYLNANHPGWVQTATATGCIANFKHSVIAGDFDNDGRPDYAVKFVAGKRGYILGFIARGRNYQAYEIFHSTASEIKRTGMAFTARGTRVDLGEPGETSKMHTLRTDALTVGTCESEGVFFTFRNGKFSPLE